MRLARLVAVPAAVLAFAAPAAGVDRALPPAPNQLHAFLLRADEPPSHTFARTPSFAWLPVPGADRYEFELANSPSFNEGSIVWSDTTLRTPAASVPYSLPWMTGSPYALYAHVRAWTADGAGEWSDAFGFNMRWTALPQPVPTYPGLLSWSTIPGATSYDVWLLDPNKVISTRSNAADEREYYDFHQQPSWSGVVHWRVRAVRNLYGSDQGLPNALPAVTYGPWSKTYTSANPPISTGPIKLAAAFSDVTSSAAQPEAHRLTPAFAFTGNQALDGKSYELFRPYVFTDSDCVNVVFRGAIVGSPAYAPRTTGPVKLPVSQPEVDLARAGYLKDGDEPVSYMADTATLLPTEMDKASVQPPTDTQAPAAPTPQPASGSSSGSSNGSSSGSTPVSPPATRTTPSGDPSQGPSGPNLSLPSTPKVTGAPVDLWDSGWPNGRYYWTVVGVKEVLKPQTTTSLAAPAAASANSITVVSATGFPVGAAITVGSGGSQEAVSVLDVNGNVLTLSRGLTNAHPAAEIVVNPSPGLEYHDAELPQDACATGRVASFGKVNEPVLAGSTSPYASGLSPTGRLIAAVSSRPTFYGTPLVAWQPAVGADEYQVQWSQTKYPWNPVGQRYTYGTSTVLDDVVSGKRVSLAAGTWYYRVRGLDFSLPGTARAMSWSDPVGFTVAKPVFKVVGQKPKTSGTRSGLKQYDSASDGFSLSAPASWHGGSPSAVSLVRYLAYDPKPAGGFRTSVNVVQGAPRGNQTDAEWLQANFDGLKRAGFSGTVDARYLKLGAGHVLRLSYRQAIKGRVLSYVQYAFDAGTKSFVLTCTTQPSTASRYAATFAAIAKSFRVTA
jgi:hypothetical protein